MKFILLADPHSGIKKANDHWLDLFLVLYSQICEEAKKRSIKHFICVGDQFHNRSSISVKTLSKNVKVRRLLQYTFDESYFIVGNHDMFYKDQHMPSALEIFSDHKGITIVDKPTTLDKNIVLVPYLFENSIFKTPNIDFMIGHFDINGIRLNKSGVESKGFTLNQSDFKKYKRVFSGHFHTKGDYGNIHYLGSPYHMEFGDDGARGYYIFDTETNELEFIEFSDAPKFVTVTHDQLTGREDVNGNIVKLVFTEDIGTNESQKIINQMNEWEPLQLIPKFDFDKKFTNTKQIEGEEVVIKDNKELLKGYIEESGIPENLNKTVLLDIIDTFYKELVQ
jgi:DNA repair exonuclease SbcCD nuclease subunit